MARRFHELLLLLTMFLLGGCGGGTPKQAEPPPQPTGPAALPGAQPGFNQSPTGPTEGEARSGGDFDDGAESAPPASAAPSEESALDRSARRESRPGLGTVWGESRSSSVQNVHFERATPDQPNVVSTIFYNDRSGVLAMGGRSNLRPVAEFDPGSGLVSVQLADEFGQPLPSFASGGRQFVVGEHGQRYTIQIRNRTSQRIEVVASVDGLDVIDGQPASFEKRGYVVRPFSTLEIDGFRQSMDEVAAFRFGSVSDSYAERKGKGRHVGVIGVAFFGEQGDSLAWSFQDTERRLSADPFPGRFATPPGR